MFELSEGAPTLGILALQGDVAEHTSVLVALGARVVEVRTPADLAQVEGLILPGGESTTVSVLLETSGLLQPLRERLASGMPAFGTCAGMITLADEVLDGRGDQHRLGAIDISVRRNAFGRQVDSFETSLQVLGLGSLRRSEEGIDVETKDEAPMHAVFIRAPVVERVGPDVEVLATVRMADGVQRPVVCRQGPVIVAAFHPELTGETRLHELFKRICCEARISI